MGELKKKFYGFLCILGEGKAAKFHSVGRAVLEVVMACKHIEFEFDSAAR